MVRTRAGAAWVAWVAFVVVAVGSVLLTLTVGTARITQLRRQVRKNRT